MRAQAPVKGGLLRTSDQCPGPSSVRPTRVTRARSPSAAERDDEIGVGTEPGIGPGEVDQIARTITVSRQQESEPETRCPAPGGEIPPDLGRDIQRAFLRHGNVREHGEASRQGGRIEVVRVQEGAQVHVLAIDDVDFIEARDDAVAIHAGPKEHLKPQRLAALAGRLDPDRFIRVHRSFVVNIDRISRIELYAKDSRIAILADSRQIPVSRTGYARLRELL